MNPLSRPTDPTGPSLAIQRLACQIGLPAGMEQPAAALNRISRIAQRDLAGACADALGSLPEDADAIYRIHHLHLALWIDLQGMSEADIARRWGRLLADSVMRAIHSGGPDTVLRFESPRHFVTSFLADLTDGRAWQRWCYDEFKPLQRLPGPLLAMQLLAARPSWIAPTLLDLAATGHAERLIESWRQPEIETLWTSLGFSPTPAPVIGRVAGLPGALTDAWRNAALSDSVHSDARARDRFRLWLQLAAYDHTLAKNADLAATLHALVELAALLRIEPEMAPLLMMQSKPYPTPQRRSEAEPAAELTSWLTPLRRIAAGPVAELTSWLAPLTATDNGRQTLAQLARWVEIRSATQPTNIAPRPQAEAKTQRARRDALALSSPIGSIFLLSYALAELDLWQRWLDEQGEETARRYLFTVALKALGRERAPLHLGDRMLAAFAGLAEPPLADLRLPPEPDRPAGAWADSLPAIAARWYPADARYWQAAIVEDEAPHLHLGQKLGYPWLTPTLDAALSVVTLLALRRTAARLPRFDQASPAYLARHFLAQPATLRTDQDAWTVQLSGGPLAVVLRMASFPESIDLPWLPLPLRLTLPARM
jgi:hypothetical protein